MSFEQELRATSTLSPFVPRPHSRLAPSKAHQWLYCPGAPNLEARVPEQSSSVFAAEGTVAHLVRSECLDFGFEPYDYIGKTITVDGHSFEVDQEMADHLQPGIDRCRDWDGKEYVEYRVSLDRWLPGTKGTLDYGRACHDVIRIDDLKYGAGVQVSPVKNPQEMLYALGFWDNEGQHRTWAEKFILSIDQPRAGGYSEWEVSLDELREFGGWVREAGKATENPDAPRVAGEKQCQWCRAQSICPEFQAFNLKTVQQKFEDLDNGVALGIAPTLPVGITPEQRTYVIRHASMFTDWLDLLRSDAINDLAAGRPVPGLKAVIGREGKRAWNDEEKAIAAVEPLFGADAFTRKVISPTQVEKKLGKKILASDAHKDLRALITRAPGKPCLVSDDDPRQAIVPVADRFEDLTNYDEGA